MLVVVENAQIETVRAAGDFEIRRELRDSDLDAVAELHERLYTDEYGLDRRFSDTVRASIEACAARGWPAAGGAWLVDRGDELRGCLALTHEGPGRGQVRWFLLAPELRGLGLGRRLLDELVAHARAERLRRLELTTFSALATAAHLYRGAGFRVVAARETTEWGPPIVLQRYDLHLG
jgi:ribosomal protein S18 acetylase RimI-like enzyme